MTSLPRLFRTMSMKDSMDASPCILSSVITCTWISVHIETLPLQTPASFYPPPNTPGVNRPHVGQTTESALQGMI